MMEKWWSDGGSGGVMEKWWSDGVMEGKRSDGEVKE